MPDEKKLRRAREEFHCNFERSSRDALSVIGIVQHQKYNWSVVTDLYGIDAEEMLAMTGGIAASIVALVDIIERDLRPESSHDELLKDVLHMIGEHVGRMDEKRKADGAITDA